MTEHVWCTCAGLRQAPSHNENTHPPLERGMRSEFEAVAPSCSSGTLRMLIPGGLRFQWYRTHLRYRQNSPDIGVRSGAERSTNLSAPQDVPSRIVGSEITAQILL
eukprot:926395-Prorocentrum_minimum.AAC.5